MTPGDNVTVREGVIRKSGKKNKILLKGGDVVKVIAIHADIIIVEKGNDRFSLNLNEVVCHT